MKKKLFTMFLSAFLALTMAFLPSMQVFAAAENGQYLSELCIGYGDDGKQRLIDAGYKIIQASAGNDFNANEGNNGDVTYIGYKTTNNPNEAITDIATMNMKGGYSFDEYSKEIDALNAKVTDMLNSFEATIDEFRTNYGNGSPYATAAYNLLSKITEDDTQKTIAELFLDEETSSDTLMNIFMQGNSDVLQAIYLGLAVACADYNPNGETETFLDRLENVEYSKNIDDKNAVARSYISAALDDFVEELKTSEKYYAEYEEYCAGSMSLVTYDDYYDSITDEEKRTEAEYYITLYDAADSYDYGDTEFTFLEAMMLPREHSEDNDWELDDSIIEVLAEAMTDGQAGVIMQSGIGVLVLNAYGNGIDMDEYVDICLEELSDVKTVSVYAGVDRTLFTDTDSVALTSAAIREKGMNDGNTFGVDEDELGMSTADIAGLVVGSVALASIGIYLIVLGAKKLPSAIKTFTKYNKVRFADEVWTNYLRTAVSREVLTVAVGVICVAAVITMIVFEILKAVKHEQTQNINYTQIPRAIVDLKYGNDGKKSYYAYYAVKQITATEDETDSLKLYGDLNGFNNRDQWQVLYTSKDSRLGQPLLAEFHVKADSKLSVTQSNNYLGVHGFDVELGSANLNQYASKSTVKPIYLFVKRVASNNNSNNRTNNNSNQNNLPIKNDIPIDNFSVRNNVPANNNLPIRGNTPVRNNTQVNKDIPTKPILPDIPTNNRLFNSLINTYRRVNGGR